MAGEADSRFWSLSRELCPTQFLALGGMHTLENTFNIPLDLIEVQVGSYLGENNIVRLQDRYERV